MAFLFKLRARGRHAGRTADAYGGGAQHGAGRHDPARQEDAAGDREARRRCRPAAGLDRGGGVLETRAVSARGTWLFLMVGAVIGLAVGILVSVTTDVPFAPEVGLVLGALLGWLSRRSTAGAGR